MAASSSATEIDFDLLEEVEEVSWKDLLAQSTYHRVGSQSQQCWDLAIRGLAVCPESSKVHFYYELSIVAFYLKLYKEGLQYTELVLDNPLASDGQYNDTISNLKFYVQAIQGKHSNTNIKDYYKGLPESFTGSSISYSTGVGGKLTRCYRAVNYRIENHAYIVVRTEGLAPNIVHTRNFLVDDSNTVRELICPEWMIPYYSNVRGLEDVRLFGDNMFTCTSRCHTSNNTAKVCYGEYDHNGVVTCLLKVSYQNDNVNEKNFLPFMYDFHPHLINIYQNTLLVMRIDLKTGKLTTVIEVPLANGRRLRGSAGPVPYKDGWLFTVHEGSYGLDRCYYHRIVWASGDFKTIKQGKIFSFAGRHIEFNIGIYIDHNTGEIVLGYSKDDSSAHEVRIKEDNPWMPSI